MRPAAVDGQLPLEQYGAIGDGRSVAFVGADGSIDWWCVPNLDSPPLLDRLLDAGRGGFFAVRPCGEFTLRRAYRADSNVLETVFETGGGSARLVESLNSSFAGRLPWCELARRVEGIAGRVTFEVVLALSTRAGTISPWCEERPDGHVFHVGTVLAMLRTSADVERTDGGDRGARARFVAEPGSRTTVALVAVDDEPLAVPPIEKVDARIDDSDQAWRRWAEGLGYRGPYPEAVRRSALALKLLLFSPSGAIAAAATTSLPERIGGDKNFDYRFAWVRDAAYSIKALMRVGAQEEAKAAFSWLLQVIRRHGPALHVFYTLNGDLPGDDETAVAAPSYRGSGAARLGNAAHGQRQLGMYGDLLETAAHFVATGHVLDGKSARLLTELTDRCADAWHRPDAGIWELREERHYTMSKIGCWLALTRAAQLARDGHFSVTHAGRWEREAERIVAWIDAHCWSEAKRAYTFYAGTERLDASLLLANRFALVRRERLDLTRRAVQRELARGVLVYRYSGAQEEEGAFLACSFWLVEALALLGHPAEARATMDALLARTGGNLGLLNEMMDPESGAMLGNAPQALSHLALIHAAASLGEGEAAG